MASPPWRSNVGSPSDEELDRVVQAHEDERRKDEEQRCVEVKKLVADEAVYTWRLEERGYREFTFWGKGRYRGRRLTNITRRHTASAAVNAGSIKALRTALPADRQDALKSLPRRPSIAWLKMIDKDAAIDQARTELAEREKRQGIACATNVNTFRALDHHPVPGIALSTFLAQFRTRRTMERAARAEQIPDLNGAGRPARPLMQSSSEACDSSSGVRWCQHELPERDLRTMLS